MFEGPGQPGHFLVLLVVALIVLGPGKRGEVGGQLGRGLRDFRAAVEGRDRKPPRPPDSS